MKRVLSFILVICLAFLVACKKPKSSQNEEFDLYLDQLFLDFLGRDPYEINSTLFNSDDLELEDLVVQPYDFSVEAEEEYFVALKDTKESLLEFTNNKLTKEQRLSKDIILDYIDRKLAFEGLHYYGSNLGSYLGYQAQLPIALAEYRFDDLQDIEYYFDYLETSKANFQAMIEYENEKIKLNMGLTDYVIDAVIEQCEKFVDADENYLIPVFNDKVGKLSFLTDAQKISLKERNKNLINRDFVGAYQYLGLEMKKMKGTANHNGALANFPKGKQYYEALFQEATGTNMSVLEAKEYLEDVIADMIAKASFTYSGKFATNLIKDMKIDDLIPYFIDQMTQDFPKLKVDITYDIKNINESMQENSSPAMYFISPIDEIIEEVIYINPINFSELNNYTYQTIAHEGYPGHLYQNVFMKTTDLPDVRKILHYVGYAEGWATYVENYVVGFVDKGAVPAFQFYDAMTYLYLGLLDIGINYEGWSETQAYEFLKSNFQGITREEALDMFYNLTEVPTNYLQYYFSYFQVQDLKASFKKKMGTRYNDLLFHTIYLETGPSSFTILKQQYDEYK